MGIRVTTPVDVSGSVVGTTNKIPTAWGGTLGVAFFYNASPYDMTAETDDGNTFSAPANTRKRVPLYNQSQYITWTVIAVPTSSNPPSTTVWLELYSDPTQAPTEDVVNLGRQFNVGNSIPVAQSATSVVNDGNTVPTTVLEATPTGSASSSAKILNDGSGVLSGGKIAFDANGNITTIAAGGVPLSGLGAGTVPSGVKVPAPQVQAGTFPGNMSVPAGDSFNVSNVAAGATGKFEMSDPDLSFAYMDLNADRLRLIASYKGGASNELMSIGAQNQDVTFHGTVTAPAIAAPISQVASAGGSVTAPQLETDTAGAGLSAKDSKASGFVELYPTETDATARGIQFDYIDNTAVLHAGPRLETTGVFAGRLRAPTGAAYDTSSHFSGTGAGTFNHNYVDATPNYIGITSLEGNSTETVGVDTITASTVHVNQGVGGWPWTGFATFT